MKILNITFSPTGGTKKVADIFANALGQDIHNIDLTDKDLDFSSIAISSNDLCIFAVPAYGGRIPSTATSRIQKLRGNHAKAVLIAVYGNREFDDTLLELQDITTAVGFTSIAGVGAIAEHSIVRQFAANRPDVDDQVELESFAAKILSIAEQEHMNPPKLPGNVPYKEIKSSSAKPITDDNCVACGLCAAKCPVGAISMEHPNETDHTLCISCMRCISVCPKQARSISPDIIAAFTQKLEPVCSLRKSNTLYL